MEKSKHLKKLFAGMMIAFLAVSCAKKKKDDDDSNDPKKKSEPPAIMYSTSALANDVDMVMETTGDKPMTYLVTKTDKSLFAYMGVKTDNGTVMAAVPVMIDNATQVKADAIKVAEKGIFAIENTKGIYAVKNDKPMMATEMLVAAGAAAKDDASDTNTGKAMVSGDMLYYPLTTAIDNSTKVGSKNVKLVSLSFDQKAKAVDNVSEVDKIFKAKSGVFVVDNDAGIYAIKNSAPTKSQEKLAAGKAGSGDAKSANTNKAVVSGDTIYYPVTSVIDSTKRLVGFNMKADNMSTAVDNITLAADKITIFPVKGGVFVAEDGVGVRAVMNDNISKSGERLVLGGITKTDVGSTNNGKAMVSGDRLYYPLTNAAKNGSMLVSMTLTDNATETTADIAVVEKIFKAKSGVFVVDDGVGVYAIKNNASTVAHERLDNGTAASADAASGNTAKAMVSGDMLYYPVTTAIKNSKMASLSLDDNSKETTMNIAAVDGIFAVEGGAFVVDNGVGVYAISNDNVSKAVNRIDNSTIAGTVDNAKVTVSMSKKAFFHEGMVQGTLTDNYTMLMQAKPKK